MKKLMVALTAVALGACAWAATPTLTGKVEFKDKTPGSSWTPETDWAYSGNDASEALKIAGGAGAAVLEIKTGTAALTRNVAQGGGAAAIGEGIYIDTMIDFQNQALDDVPTATNDEKIAIFVLDTTEIEGAPAGTNVYVMAGRGRSGKALYRLAGFNGDITSGKHRVVVKSYADVIEGNETTRTGFLVYIQDNIQDGDVTTFAPCTVDLSNVYAIGNDGAVTWTNVGTTDDYLGLATDGIQTTAAVARWVNTRCLFLSMPTSDSLKQGNLSAVDFVGNAQIASVEVTADNPGFEPDLFTMTLAATGVTVELARGEGVNQGVNLVNGVLTATAADATVKVCVTLTGDNNMVTASGPADLTEYEPGKWSFTFANGGTVSFTGSQAAATVDGTKYPTIEAAIEAANDNGGTLKLAQATTWPETGSAIRSGVNVTLDLAGNTLTFPYGGRLENYGTLTIVDTISGGTIVGTIFNNEDGSTSCPAVDNYGTLTINAGIFDGEVYNEGTVTINGGSFLKTYNSTEGETPAFTLAGSVAQGLEVVTDGDYWKVQTKAAASVALTINATGATISGVEEGTVTEGSNITFTVTAAADYKNPTVTVTGAEVTADAGTYSFTVGKENITITVKATAIKYATLTITPVDNCTIVVKNGNDVEFKNGDKFDVDDKVELTVTRTPDPGYELDGCAATETIDMTTDQMVTAKVKAVTPEVAPGKTATVTAESAAAAKDMVELKATSPNVEIVSDAIYTSYFTKQATDNGDGTFTVTAVLNDEIVQAADVTAEVAAELNAVAADKATAATVTKAKPGLYYSVKYTDNVASMATAVEGDRVMAKGASVEVPMPKVVNANAMFYQVQVNVAPKPQ